MAANFVILITGSNGQVGFELQRALAPLGRVIASDRYDCDLADADRLSAHIRAVRPDVIVNAAGYTAVDRAELERDVAFDVNAHALGIIGAEATKLGASVVHYSTDYVFRGDKAGPYIEDDQAEPLNVYGHSKLAGEQALLASCRQSLVLRTTWVVGAHGGNFAKTILRLAGEKNSLDIVADQYGAPTSAALIADVTAHLLRKLQTDRGKFPFGVYHLSASGRTSWHEYAVFVVEEAIKAGRVLKVAPSDIRAIPSSAYPVAAERPLNSILSSEKLCSTFQLRLPAWQDGLIHILKQIL